MAKEIIINAEKEQTRIAIVEHGELVELYIENPQNERTLGDICLGRVRKIMPSIQAAFVDIGQKQDAFLHFSDLSDNLGDLLTFLEDPNPEVGKHTIHPDQHRARGKRRRPHGQRQHKSNPPETSNGSETQEASAEAEQTEESSRDPRSKTTARTRGLRRSTQRKSRHKTDESQEQGSKAAKPDKAAPQKEQGSPDIYLKRDQSILVKIVKEPISSKGSRVSTDISLAGRFLVLVPLADYVAVSKKISSYKERRRLRALAKSLAPDGFGVIVRTVAEGRNAKALDTDLRLLVEKWRKIEKKLAGKPSPPLLVHEDVNMVSSVIRDLFSEDYDRILVDDPKLYRNIKSYVQAVAPQMVPAVQIHKNNKPIFEATSIARDAAQVFESRVDLPTGGYLFIERTEAMYVIDVNSGRSGRGMTQEVNSLKVNLEAARVLARQVRLRDIGGIIVVDFIDLREDKNRQKVYDELKKEFRKDRAVTKILPMSDFGLVQITRQRLRPSVSTMVTTNGKSGSDAEKSVPVAASPKGKAKEADDPPAPRKLHEPLVLEISPEQLIQKMEQWIVDYKKNSTRRAVTLVVHPFTAAYLNRKVPNVPTRWFMKHLVRIRMETNASMNPMTYRFVDPHTGSDLTKGIPGDKKPGDKKKEAESAT